MHFMVQRFIQLLNAHRSIDVTYRFVGDHYEVHFNGLPATLWAQLRALTYQTPTAVYDADKNVYLSAKYPVFVPKTPDGELICHLYENDYAKKISIIDTIIHHV